MNFNAGSFTTRAAVTWLWRVWVRYSSWQRADARIYSSVSSEYITYRGAGERNFYTGLGSDNDICFGDVSVKAKSSRLTKGEIK